MQVWNAFSGYRDIYGKPPSAQQVQRVRLFLLARNEYDYELYLKQQRELDRVQGDGDLGEQRRSISIG